MWGFATQTGAGLAIAGLTATYYALAHRNYHGEREVGRGDGPQVNGQGRITNNEPPLSPSQMLLKKELAELSGLHGSASGLNILYQPSHPLYRFQKSRFEITPIISRVNASSSAVFSEDSEEDIPKANEIDSDVLKSTDTPPSLSSQDSPIADIEEKLNMSEAQLLLQGLEEELDVPPNHVNSAPPSDDSLEEQWKTAQEGFSLTRSTSPICFFKNPGFGNRFAFRMKNELEPVLKQALDLATASEPQPSQKESESSKVIIEKDSKAVQVTPEEEDYKDSTQFILSPVLSESNDSLCDKETPEKYIKNRKTQWKQPPTKIQSESEKEEHTELVSKGPVKKTNPLEEISEYNDQLRKKMFQNRECLKSQDKSPLIRLRADPETFQLCTVPVQIPPQKRNGKPVLLSTPDNGNSTTQIINTSSAENVKPEPEVEKAETEISIENVIDPNSCGDAPATKITPDTKPLPLPKWEDDDVGGVYEEPLLVPSQLLLSRPSIQTFPTSPSSHVTGIPRDSWISLPIRVYTNSMGSMPWSLVGFCVLVVIIAGFVGMILSKLANQIAIEKQLR